MLEIDHLTKRFGDKTAVAGWFLFFVAIVFGVLGDVVPGDCSSLARYHDKPYESFPPPS